MNSQDWAELVELLDGYRDFGWPVGEALLMCRKVNKSLANDRTVAVDADSIALARKRTHEILGTSDHSDEPSATLAKTTWLIAGYETTLSKHALVVIASEVASPKNDLTICGVTENELLRVQLAVVSAFDLAFQKPRQPFKPHAKAGPTPV